MKIFNWVHRRFNHHKAENAKKSGGDEQFLLENTLLDVVGGWKGGILAIGTFGYDPLRGEEKNEENDDESFYKQESEKAQVENESYHIDNQITDSEEEDEINGEDEVNPLVVYAHDYEGLMEGNRVFEESPRKERKTLAELFYAESDHQLQEIKRKEIVKKKRNNKHATLSFAKKLIGEDARPIHKIHRLMRRMLKRKIHPDVGLNDQNPIDSQLVVKKPETTGSASVLPTQDAAV